LANNLDLCHSMEPSGFFFVLKIHLQPKCKGIEPVYHVRKYQLKQEKHVMEMMQEKSTERMVDELRLILGLLLVEVATVVDAWV